MRIANRELGPEHPPLVIPEIGINHGGDMAKAHQMIDDAADAGAEVVKFQCHVLEDEMIPEAKKIVPGNAEESIWDIMAASALDESQERELQAHVEERGLIFLSTPFSRAAADRLERLGVAAYKIGSGECNNYPLIDHIAGFGKPILLSTGMNDLPSIAKAVEVMERHGVDYGLMHCTSMYPTPYKQVRLGALEQMAAAFPRAVLGLSDHSLGPWTCFGAVSCGARILEKHFTSDSEWPGPDVPISVDPARLADLIIGSKAIFEALGGSKEVLAEEAPTIAFAYACVVTTRAVEPGEHLSEANCWVKRPGNGEIKAADYPNVLGRAASVVIPADTQLRWEQLR